MPTAQIDYDALAKQAGATATTPPPATPPPPDVDYDALAKQAGATATQHAQSTGYDTSGIMATSGIDPNILDTTPPATQQRTAPTADSSWLQRLGYALSDPNSGLADNPGYRAAGGLILDTANVAGHILHMLVNPSPPGNAPDLTKTLPTFGPLAKHPIDVAQTPAGKAIHAHVEDAANWLMSGGQPEGFWENVGALGDQFAMALLPGGAEATAERGLAEQATIREKLVKPLAEKLGVSPETAKVIINNKKLSGLLAIGAKASKDSLINAGTAYAHTEDPDEAANAALTGFGIGAVLHGGGSAIANSTENALSRFETTPTGETIVTPKPAQLTEEQLAELDRQNAADAARVKRAEDFLQTRSAAAETKKGQIAAAKESSAQGVQTAEDTHAATTGDIEASHAQYVAEEQAARDAALAKAKEDVAAELQAQQEAGQAGIRETAQQMLARHLAEINESRNVQPVEGQPPTLTFGVPHPETMEAGPTKVTGEPIDVRVVPVPGPVTRDTMRRTGQQVRRGYVPASQYQGGPEAGHATIYPPATVERPGPPEPVGGQGTMTIGAPITSENKIGSMGAADAIVGRERLKNLNAYIHSEEFDNLPPEQQNRIQNAHDDMLEKLEQYNRNRAATGNGVRPMFEPIDIPGAVKNLGSHTEAADFLHDTVTRGYDELADRAALAGKSRNTFQVLKRGYKTAEAAVRGAVGTEDLTVAETKLETAHQKMAKFLRDVAGASPAEVDQLNNSYKNYLVMRDVGRAVDGAFERNPYMAKISTAPNTYTGDKLDKALSDLVNKHGLAKVQRVMGAENLKNLQAIADQTRTAEGSKELAELTEAIGKEYERRIGVAITEKNAAIAASETARQQAIDQETARLAEATRTAEQEYKNAVGPARQQKNQEMLKARQDERTFAAQKAADKAAAAAGKGNQFIRQALPHFGAAQIVGGAGGMLGHMTGIPYMGAVGYGAGQLAYAGGYVGAKAANRAVWRAMESNPTVAKNVLYAIHNGVKAGTYVPIISELMVNQALGQNDAAQPQRQQEQK